MAVFVADDITGVILVGGKSRRMGRDKAFLQLQGRPLFERVLDLFRECFPKVVLVGDRGERFADYSLQVLPDLIPGSSLGGVYTGLSGADSEWIFVASCDLPFPSKAILQHLCSLREGFDAVVPKTRQGYEPLFALYSSRCVDPIRELLEGGECCAYAWYPRVRVKEVGPEEIAHLDPAGTAFLNLNTPEDVINTGGTI
ncbi:molybdenum cofactor guanylyltransferase [Geomonas anaerohicana]|uniref:Probable molybdenum cofactor guanylyltransferase n=1 Tax=Geomonas anaerohicana TaxID=2798583 RepID=A0ABS0YEF6_9BACT|nr:molybdenum cofactor guanylyltransferase [Geomonas anaerohicana]MBJ6750691.1 molybdenum cofactor guanylyltransferase [Geomonas anaerohicana]